MEVTNQKKGEVEEKLDKSLKYIKVLQNCAIKLLKCNFDISTLLLIIDILENKKNDWLSFFYFKAFIILFRIIIFSSFNSIISLITCFLFSSSPDIIFMIFFIRTVS